MKFKVSVFLLVGLCSFGAYLSLAQVKAFSAAYIYGYPLVIMNDTQEVMLSGAASQNQLMHNASFPDHNSRDVVRPNVDTLYTVAWLNLAAEPQVLSVPEMGERYYVSPFMDAWTNVFASVGSRTTGNRAGDYALVGPAWSGELPDGLEVIHAPTDMVWLIQRIQTNGKHDVDAVTQLQVQFSLASLSQWQAGEAPDAYVGSLGKGSATDNPYLVVDSLGADDFFAQLTQLMAQQSPLAADTLALENLASIGVSPGQYTPEAQGWLGQRLADFSLKLTRGKVKQQLSGKGSLENGWTIYRQGIGRYETDYKLRMGVAIVGLGALPPEESLYPNTNIDSAARPLSGAHSYRVHFPAGQTPPADAFWSLTMYDDDGFLIDNPLARYALGDRDSLSYNDDGSLDILLQHKAPEQLVSNWLPAPAGVFGVTMRIYAPKPEVINGDWPLPSVIRL